MANTQIHTLNRMAKDRLFTINYVVETPSDKLYMILNNSAFTFEIVNISVKTTSGTCTLDFRYNSVSVGGCDAIAASSTRAVTTATSNNSFSLGGNLTVTVSSNSSTDMLSIAVTCRRTGLE